MLNNFDSYIKSVCINFSQKNIKSSFMDSDLEKSSAFQVQFFFLFFAVCEDLYRSGYFWKYLKGNRERLPIPWIDAFETSRMS